MSLQFYCSTQNIHNYILVWLFGMAWLMYITICLNVCVHSMNILHNYILYIDTDNIYVETCRKFVCGNKKKYNKKELKIGLDNVGNLYLIVLSLHVIVCNDVKCNCYLIFLYHT